MYQKERERKKEIIKERFKINIFLRENPNMVLKPRS